MRGLLASIGVSPADVFLADKILLVEGPNDIPVFKAFLEKAPSFQGQNIAVLSLGGATASGENFDAEHWSRVHPKVWAILDSERRGLGEEVRMGQRRISSSLESAGIPCHLTESRATENYLSPRALATVYGKTPADIDPFGNPNLAEQGVRQFDKRRNGEVALAMEWREIGNTDIGIFLEKFLQA
jgi:hypothetical protein